MSKQRVPIGVDPLDTLLGDPAEKLSPRPRPTAAVPARRRVRATFHLPFTLVEEARNTTVALSGPPIRLTLARLVEEALQREVQRLRDIHNDGAPFPQRAADLVGGRPMSW